MKPTLTLYYHPLASYCHKVLIALYENDIQFKAEVIEYGVPNASDQLLEMWPVGKMPFLKDERARLAVPESTIIIEHLDQHHAKRKLLPLKEADRLQARLWDRFFDNYVQTPMQKIVVDRLRPDHESDKRGVQEARTSLQVAYEMLEKQAKDKRWIINEEFTLADCAAAPALFYATTLEPFKTEQKNCKSYFEKLMARPSVKRVIEEAKPFFLNYPYKENIPAQFL